jgi:hypothetical protein
LAKGQLWQIDLSEEQIIQLRERLRRTRRSKRRHHEIFGSERLSRGDLDERAARSAGYVLIDLHTR